MQKQYLVSTMINVEDENDKDDLQFLSASSGTRKNGTGYTFVL